MLYQGPPGLQKPYRKRQERVPIPEKIPFCSLCIERIDQRAGAFCGECAEHVLSHKRAERYRIHKQTTATKLLVEYELSSPNTLQKTKLSLLNDDLQKLREHLLWGQRKLREERINEAKLIQQRAKEDARLADLKKTTIQNVANTTSITEPILSALKKYQQYCSQVEKRRRLSRAMKVFRMFNIEVSVTTRTRTKEGPVNGSSTILKIPLPNSGNFSGIPFEVINAALSHTARLILQIATEMHVSIPYHIMGPRFLSICDAPKEQIVEPEDIAVSIDEDITRTPRRVRSSSRRNWTMHSLDMRTSLPQDHNAALALIQGNISYLCDQMHVPHGKRYPKECLLLNLHVLFRSMVYEVKRCDDGPDLPLPPLESPAAIHRQMESKRLLRASTKAPGDSSTPHLLVLEEQQPAAAGEGKGRSMEQEKDEGDAPAQGGGDQGGGGGGRRTRTGGGGGRRRRRGLCATAPSAPAAGGGGEGGLVGARSGGGDLLTVVEDYFFPGEAAAGAGGGGGDGGPAGRSRGNNSTKK